VSPGAQIGLKQHGRGADANRGAFEAGKRTGKASLGYYKSGRFEVSSGLTINLLACPPLSNRRALQRPAETNVVTLSGLSTSWFSRLFNFRDHVLYRIELAVRQRVDHGQELIISVVPLCLPSQVLFAGRKLSAEKIPSHVLALCHVSLVFLH
jgi:hypothetical protein